MANDESIPKSKPVHHGHNIRRFREVRQMKQDDLANRLGPEWTQKKISILESTETIDANLLNQVAKALNVSPDLIEKFSEDSVNQYFNSVVNDNATNVNVNGSNAVNNCTYNLANKYVEAVEKIEKLYQELLRVEREKIALLEKLVNK